MVPGWNAHVIGPGVSCFHNLNRLALPTGGTMMVFGLAGGLRSEAQTGRVFQIHSVRNIDGSILEPTASLSVFGIGGSIPSAVVACVNDVVHSPSAKASLAHRTGASLVDMESAHIAQWCLANNWKWCMVRAVLDGPNDTLPPGIMNWCDQNGKLNGWAMLRSVLFHPGLIAALPWLARANRIAGDALRSVLGHPVSILAKSH